MTRLGDEACPDYATQTLNQSTGLYEVAEPNIVKVYAGKAKLNNLLSTETGFSDVNAFSHDLIMRLGNF